MRKQRSQYDSPVDALVAVAKRLSVYENLNSMTSEDFFDNYCKGLLDDSVDFIEWSKTVNVNKTKTGKHERQGGATRQFVTTETKQIYYENRKYWI